MNITHQDRPIPNTMNKIKERRKHGAICPKDKSPDYRYNGITLNGKHEFTCNSCGYTWQYGKSESIYTKLK